MNKNFKILAEALAFSVFFATCAMGFASFIAWSFVWDFGWFRFLMVVSFLVFMIAELQKPQR